MRFFHGGQVGDIIYSLPAIMAAGDQLWIHPTEYLHPQAFGYLFPLLSELIHVGYCEKPFEGCDLNPFRDLVLRDHNLLLTQAHIQVVEKHLGHSLDVDLTLPWISVEPDYVADIVVGVTPRFHQYETIDWQLLRGHKIVFIGYDEDYNWFWKKTKMSVQRVFVSNALQTARIIRGSKLFLGNQSSAFAIAEAMKHPRVLEVCEWIPNCLPQGKDGYTYLTKELIEQYVR